MHKSNSTRPKKYNPILRTDRLIAFGLIIFFITLYISTRFQVHNQCVDCTSNATQIQRGELEHLFKGSHLIYLWLLSGIYQLISSLVPLTDAFIVAQVFNSLMASLAIGVFYLLTQTIIRQRWLSLTLTLVLAFTYHFWLFASDVEVHAAAAFFYLLSILILVRLSAAAPIWKFGLLGVLSAIAILFHVFCGLMGLVVIIFIFLLRDNQANTPIHSILIRLKWVFVYGLTTALCIVVPYLLVTTQVHHLQTVSETFSWILSFREHVGIESRMALPLLSTLINSATGIVRAFLGSIIWMATPGLKEVLLQVFPNKCVGEELYLIRSLTPGFAIVLTCLSAIAGATLFSLALLSVPGFIKELRRFSRVGIGFMVWLLLYAAMITFFSPGGYGHWAIYWLPIFFLTVGLGLSQITQLRNKRARLVKALVVTLVISLFLANFGNILLQTTADNDLYLHRLNWYQMHTNAKDLVISAGSFKWTSYLDYYLIAQVETLDRLFRRMDYLSVQQDLQAKIALTQSNGGRVYVMQDVLEPELCLARYGQWDLSLYASFRDEIFPRLDCFQNDEVQICEVVR